ncbi:MAG: hypothetical protein CMH59_17505, partial [Myxococcales bacterium]|nr:hypothetical protein [Myxococcales bacterium]
MRARLALALSLPLLATAARAQPANGAPAQAVVAGPLPGDLRARVEGQTGDLAWRLRFEPAAPRPAGLDAAARAFPEARVVVWVRGGESDALRLSLVDLRDRRLLEREVAPPEGEAFAASTLHETAALLIRGALQALSLGGEVGVAVPAPAPTPEAQRPPA